MQNEPKILGVTAGCLSLFVGGTLGGLLGVFSAYPLAALFSENFEKQAYLTIVIIPAVALVGALAASSTSLAVAFRKKVFLALAGVAWATLFVILVKGLIFSHISRPSKFRVENRTNIRFENVFIGSDFRQSKRLGAIAPNETSDPVKVDLDKPSSFNRIEGRAGAGYVRYFDSSKSLPDGDYRYVVSGKADALVYTLKKD